MRVKASSRMENGPVLLIESAMFPILSQMCDFVRFCPILKQVSELFPILRRVGDFVRVWDKERMCSKLEALSASVFLTDQIRKKFDVNSPMSTLCLELAQNLVDVTKMFLQDCPRRVWVQLVTVWTNHCKDQSGEGPAAAGCRMQSPASLLATVLYSR